MEHLDEIVLNPDVPILYNFEDGEDWETWDGGPELAEEFPYYKLGYDLNGLPGKKKFLLPLKTRL